MLRRKIAGYERPGVSNPPAPTWPPGTVVESYLYDGIDHPLRMKRGTQTVYYELDITGNVRRLRGAAGEDLGGYRYTAFGKAQTEAAPMVEQPLRWQGRWWDGSTGTYDFRARAWSPDLGLFLAADQFRYLGMTGTLWSWPGQNPVKWRDRFGRYIYSENEVTAILDSYQTDLSNSSNPLLLMAWRHQGGGSFDYITNQPGDIFEVPGVGSLSAKDFGNFIAGYASGWLNEPLAYWAVRGAGAFYGIEDPKAELQYWGDDAISVYYIDVGMRHGRMAAGCDE